MIDYIRENDYTISEVKKKSEKPASYDKALEIRNELTRTFNFLSLQVTTTSVEQIFETRGYHGGGSAAVSTQIVIQNFREIQSPQEILYMREKLVELGGNPPELKSIDFNKGLQKPLPIKDPPKLNTNK